MTATEPWHDVEPPLATDEASAVLASLDRMRGTFAWKAWGLEAVTARSDDDGKHPNLRRWVVDTIEEYSRHTGHADLLREAIDGRVEEDPPR